MLADWERERLNHLFYHYCELDRAWVFKDSFRVWYRETDRGRTEEILNVVERGIQHVILYMSLTGFQTRLPMRERRY